jgi:hypothetical protein
MHAALLTILVVATVLVIRIALRKSGFKRVFAHAAAHQWEMLIVDSFTKNEDESDRTCYAVRFRERDGTLVEGVLESHSDSLHLVKSVRIAPKVARAIFDKHLPMDCRKCGSSIAAGREQCTYCRAWRYELRIEQFQI